MRSVIQQENNESRYIIELDIGKRIVLWAANIDYYSYPQDINSWINHFKESVIKPVVSRDRTI